MRTSPLPLRTFFTVLCWLMLSSNTVIAAPFTPNSDQEIMEVLPARAADPRMRELRALRSALAAKPNDPDTAVRLARRYYEEVAAEGDPRYIGYAQAALAPWWTQADPPASVRVMRGLGPLTAPSTARSALRLARSRIQRRFLKNRFPETELGHDQQEPPSILHHAYLLQNVCGENHCLSLVFLDEEQNHIS